MAKIIVRFISFVLQFTAILFVVIGAGLGYEYITEHDPNLSLIGLVLGAGMGFIIATVFLGVPLLIIRINQNLEDINRNIFIISESINRDKPLVRLSDNL